MIGLKFHKLAIWLLAGLSSGGLLLMVSSAATSAEAAPNKKQLAVEMFAKLPFFQGLSLSPDGQKMAFIAPINGRKHLLSKSLVAKNAKYHVLPPGDKSDIAWFRWASNERLLVSYSATVRSLSNDFEETRLLSTDFAMTDPVWVVRPDRDRDGISYGQIQDQLVDLLPDEPDHILLALDLQSNGAYGIEKINIRTRGRVTVERPRSGIQSWLADTQGLPRLAWGFDDNERKVIYRNPGDGDIVPLLSRFGVAGFYDDPQFGYAFTVVDGRAAISKRKLLSGEIIETVYANEQYDVADLIWDSTGRRVVGVQYADHYPRAYYFESEYTQIQDLIDQLLPATANQIWQALPGQNLYVISVESDRQPLQFALFDLKKKSLDLIASTREDIDSELMVPVQPVEFVARDNTVIPAYLTRARGLPASGLPMVVLPHGGPRSRDTRSFNYLVQLIASRGYAVLQANFRGSSGFGQDWLNAGDQQWGGLMQDDITDATQWAIDEGIADPERICIVGWSYGGYSALMGAIGTPDLYRCAASINGVADVPDMIDNTHGFIGGRYMTDGMGLDGVKPRDVSPLHQSDRIKIPLFLAAAKDDSTVPFEQSRDLYRKLRKKLPVSYVEVKSGGHSLDHEDGRLEILSGLVEFLDKNLD